MQVIATLLPELIEVTLGQVLGEGADNAILIRNFVFETPFGRPFAEAVEEVLLLGGVHDGESGVFHVYILALSGERNKGGDRTVRFG